jgi:ssDNA-binding replication factor A large subunit
MTTKIKELRPGMQNLTIEARVIEKSKTEIRRGKKYAKVIIEDESGKIVLNLWRNQVDQVDVNRRIRISRAFVHRRGAGVQVSTWEDIKEI